jgi:hypothetical protein
MGWTRSAVPQWLDSVPASHSSLSISGYLVGVKFYVQKGRSDKESHSKAIEIEPSNFISAMHHCLVIPPEISLVVAELHSSKYSCFLDVLRRPIDVEGASQNVFCAERLARLRSHKITGTWIVELKA